ncbi:MAG: ATP-dependent protease subunit HslV [Planctomycetes bacterium]|nr:ATP-dependent protease subunit HslV [Planctomycetota bacterium]
METFHATTILSVRKDGAVAIGGDGQVTLGNEIFKHGAKKIRKLADGAVLVGFAGSAADAFALMERFEKRLGEFNNNLVRAATELAKDWRLDRSLRRLESMMITVDTNTSLLLGGSGDIIEPDDGVLGIGSGGGYASAAARALIKYSNLSAKEIVREALEIASASCIYTNNNIVVEEL